MVQLAITDPVELKRLVAVARDPGRGLGARLDAMRVLGDRMLRAAKRRGGRPRNDGRATAGNDGLVSLADLGIPRKLSSIAQLLATVPDDTFRRIRSAGSLRSALRAARGIEERSIVYFVQGEQGGPIKIGWTIDMENRLHQLQCGSPVALRVIATVPGGVALESDLHGRLAEHRLHGEWFADVPAVRAAMNQET